MCLFFTEVVKSKNKKEINPDVSSDSDSDSEVWENVVPGCPKGIPHHDSFIGLMDLAQASDQLESKLGESLLKKRYRQRVENNCKLNDEMFPCDEEIDQQYQKIIKAGISKLLEMSKGIVRVQRADKAGGRKNGSGTGFLVYIPDEPFSSESCYLDRVAAEHGELTKFHKERSVYRPIGWQPKYVVMTNSHLIRSIEEAKGAKVAFFFDKPGGEGVVSVDVTGILPQQSARTPHKSYASYSKMDFVFLTLKSVPHNVEPKILCTSLLEGTKYYRDNILMCISHPHGHSKRISFGYSSSEVDADYYSSATLQFRHPARDIISVMYDLPTCKGSSGAPVFMLCVDPYRKDIPWKKLQLCFELKYLHYKTGKGVRMSSIEFNVDGEHDEIYNLFCN